MTPEKFVAATQFDARIRNVAAASSRLLASNDYKLDLTGLPNEDREAIKKLALDYLDAEENKARAGFDAL